MPTIGTMRQIENMPLGTAEVLTPQKQAEQYAREAEAAAVEAAASAEAAQEAAEGIQGVAEDVTNLKSAVEQRTKQIAAETGIVFETWAVGSFQNDDGKTPIDSTNRIRLNEYLSLDDFSGISQESGYGLYYYVYDSTYGYIDRSNGWRTSTAPITPENIKSSWPNAKYIHLLLRKNNNAQLSLSDASRVTITYANKTLRDEHDNLAKIVINTISPTVTPVKVHNTNNQIQGLCRVNDKYWQFTPSYTNTAGKIYVFDDAWGEPTIHYHNLGHASNFFYSPFNDCLFVGNCVLNGVGVIGIFKNASKKTDLYTNDSDFISIPISYIDSESFALIQGDAWNDLYILWNNKIRKFQLGTGENALTNTELYGSLISGCDEFEYNGTAGYVDGSEMSFPANALTVQCTLSDCGLFYQMAGTDKTVISVYEIANGALQLRQTININAYNYTGSGYYAMEPEGLVRGNNGNWLVSQWDTNSSNHRFFVSEFKV